MSCANLICANYVKSAKGFCEPHAKMLFEALGNARVCPFRVDEQICGREFEGRWFSTRLCIKHGMVFSAFSFDIELFLKTHVLPIYGPVLPIGEEFDPNIALRAENCTCKNNNSASLHEFSTPEFFIAPPGEPDLTELDHIAPSPTTSQGFWSMISSWRFW